MNAIECDIELAGSQRLKDYGVFPHEVRHQGRSEQWRALHRALAGADVSGARRPIGLSLPFDFGDYAALR
jgi:hypothetical protein